MSAGSRASGDAYPWAAGAALALPALALVGAGAAAGLSATGIGLFAAGTVYLALDLLLLQPRLERRGRLLAQDPELAAQGFLQRALEVRDLRQVADEFETAVQRALGDTLALLVAPSPDGGVRILGGRSHEVPGDLGDATEAFLWLGDNNSPIYRAQLESDGTAGSADALRLMTKLDADVLLPLRHRGLLLGLGAIGRPTNPDLERVESFHRAMRAYTTVAVANTYLDAEARDRRQLTQTFDLATAVQESLMPDERPVRRPGFSLRGVYRPVAECGGDLWAWRELPGGRVLLVIADATGHGAAPALLAAVAKGAIDAQWQLNGEEIDPGRLLTAMNRSVFRSGRRRYLMTAFAAVVDLATGRCQFANAGQNFPYVLGQRGLEPLVARGNALGAQPEATYDVHSRNLAIGDKLLIYTDGFVEAGSPEKDPFGEKRFRALLMQIAEQPAIRWPDLLVAKVNEYLEGSALGDDMTCVAFELTDEEE